jgi:quercetin dioxygenase-like cupin family protein
MSSTTPRLLLAATLTLLSSPAAMAQATSRPCSADPAREEQPGPACLMAHQELGSLAGDAVYWRLDTYPTLAAAQKDRTGNAAVVEAYGKVWLFTVGTSAAPTPHGEHVAVVGPLPVAGGARYEAEFLRSTFSPGMTAPVHVHSGPEAFYAVSGDTCLETPDGVQTGRGPGNSLVVRGGPPMLLMATGPTVRKGFALILHGTGLPPTTLVHHWTPAGLCKVAMQ